MYVLNLNRTTHFTTTVLSASRDLCPVWLRRSKLLVMIDIQVCTGIVLVFKPTLSLLLYPHSLCRHQRSCVASLALSAQSTGRGRRLRNSWSKTIGNGEHTSMTRM